MRPLVGPVRIALFVTSFRGACGLYRVNTKRRMAHLRRVGGVRRTVARVCAAQGVAPPADGVPPIQGAPIWG